MFICICIVYIVVSKKMSHQRFAELKKNLFCWFILNLNNLSQVQTKNTDIHNFQASGENLWRNLIYGYENSLGPKSPLDNWKFLIKKDNCADENNLFHNVWRNINESFKTTLQWWEILNADRHFAKIKILLRICRENYTVRMFDAPNWAICSLRNYSIALAQLKCFGNYDLFLLFFKCKNHVWYVLLVSHFEINTIEQGIIAKLDNLNQAIWKNITRSQTFISKMSSGFIPKNNINKGRRETTF